MTLADVAEDAGISAAALVQRFGSKRALLLAAAADAAGGADYIFPGLRARYRSPFAALLGLAECMSIMGDTRENVANTLAFLHGDLSDPEFREHALTSARNTHAGIAALIRDAIAARELVRCNVNRLASAVQAALEGSLRTWAIHGEGDMAKWIRRDLKMVLDGYVAERRRPGG